MNSPAYDPDLVSAYTPDYWGPYYGYYGRGSYSDDDYRYPDNWVL